MSADFKDKQIEKLLVAISKLEGKSGEAVEAARDKFKARRIKIEQASDAACKAAAAKFQQKIDVLEKQLKALGGSR